MYLVTLDSLLIRYILLLGPWSLWKSYTVNRQTIPAFVSVSMKASVLIHSAPFTHTLQNVLACTDLIPGAQHGLVHTETHWKAFSLPEGYQCCGVMSKWLLLVSGTVRWVSCVFQPPPSSSSVVTSYYSHKVINQVHFYKNEILNLTLILTTLVSKPNLKLKPKSTFLFEWIAHFEFVVVVTSGNPPPHL